VGVGDEVVTVSHSYIATANSIRYCGAIPVFVDIDPLTGNLNPSLVEHALGPKTRAILCVHQIGLPCDLPSLAALARRHGVPLIEDAACAIGSEIDWQGQREMIGRPHGDAACFSFHPRKVLSTGDGGMITTRHRDWDANFRRWRQHGMSVADTVRHGSGTVIFESYPDLGYNYRMTDIQAAVGREQLKRLPEFVRVRRERAARYRLLLEGNDAFTLPFEPAWARSNWQSFAVRLSKSIDQRQVMQSLLDRGIATRRGIMCAHREPAYAHEPWRKGSELTCSEEAQDQSVLLPLYHTMTDEEQDYVAQELQAAISQPVSL
jgi:dTDP-4-amino-4,6-dideoxygalactose transaminase